MFKYCRMEREIPSRLVCGSHGAHLDSTLFEVQVTAGQGFFLHSSHLVHSETTEGVDSLFQRASAFLAVL